MRRIALLLCLLFSLTWIVAAQNGTVIHVINVKWKADASKEAIQSALDGAKALTKSYPGILKVWTKSIKNQLSDDFDQQIVMQFRDAAALKEYADSAAQKEWYKVYMPVRDHSRTCDVSE